MKRALLLSLAVVPLAVLTASRATGSPDIGDAVVIGPAIPLIMQEPVLNFDVTGSTLLGPFHTRLTVYNSGLVTGSSCGGPSGANSAGTAFAAPKAVAKLQEELINAGGLTLPDQNIIVADVPLTTVTVFKGDTNARAHTFSYWLSSGNYSAIGQIIADFAAKYPVSCSGITSLR